MSIAKLSNIMQYCSFFVYHKMNEFRKVLVFILSEDEHFLIKSFISFEKI